MQGESLQKGTKAILQELHELFRIGLYVTPFACLRVHVIRHFMRVIHLVKHYTPAQKGVVWGENV